MKFTFTLPDLPKFSFPQINQVILIILLSEFVLAVAAAFTAPVFALFVVRDVSAPIFVIGIAAAIYWGVKSILQLPISRYLDKNHGEIDDYYSMLFGLVVVVFVTYLYYFVNSAWQIYVLQFFSAVGNAFIVPPFFAIFSRHLDKDREAFEWALWSSFSIGAGTALGSLVSGILASVMGVRPLFLVSGTFILVGLIVLFFLRPYIKPKVPRGLSQFYPHTKTP